MDVGENPRRWAEIVQKITEGDASGIEQLYQDLRVLVRGKFLANFSRMTGGYCFEDSVHEVLLIVLDAIRSGQLRDPEKLPGFIRTVARRQIVAYIRGVVARRRFTEAVEISTPDSPEARLRGVERVERVRTAIEQLGRRDREIIERFYFKEQSAEQICQEMNLTGTQFRLYKSRAIAKCSQFVAMRDAAVAVSRPVPAGLRIA